MSTFLMMAASNATQVGIFVGIIVFLVLFFKLIMGFIRFMFRHPIWFILLLALGGLGLAFNLLLGGVVILAVLAGGGIMFAMNSFDI
ncbi:hypothetical protein LOSG293_130380 [Secundilactobacillus oryzae JCM 18671]|uniref:Uncharacterized protein n=1 Tax=Secundilactobacillus oryzae JCM 18671 TaxID=1291743 RepID=A0A081BII1_9LACO|nr:hypothetical protein [Secundilactobacillus oryzae]GAK47849.1 hypothetical protein LOSG293_130380 [Secundilactobacillus oryzae JCM 18671]